jgi:hypothetical protein
MNNISENEHNIVQVTVEFVKMGEIDTINEKYNAEIIIEAKWITKDIIEVYNPEQHWNPQLFIENSLQEPKEKIKHKLIEKCYNITYFIFFVVVKFLIYYN